MVEMVLQAANIFVRSWNLHEIIYLTLESFSLWSNYLCLNCYENPLCMTSSPIFFGTRKKSPTFVCQRRRTNHSLITLFSLPPFPFRTCAKRQLFVEQWRKHGFNNWETKISSPLAFRSAWASLAQFDDSSYASSCSTIFFFSYSVRASSFTCVQPRREEGRGKKRAPQGGFCYLGKKNVEKLVRKQRKLICSLILESFKTTVVSYVHLLAMTPRDSTTFSLMK